MAFRRRTFCRRRNFRRRRGGSMWTLAKKAASKVVRHFLNPEYKFLDVQPAFSITNTGTVFADTSYVAQGDAATNRNGNSIKITSMLTRLAFIWNTAAASGSAVRLIFFTDASSAGVVPAVTDVIQSANVQAPMNRLNGSRFKVIRDYTIVLSSDKPRVNIESFKKMSHHIKYLDGTATATSLGQGPIYMLAISNEGLNYPSISGYVRMRFLDN